MAASSVIRNLSRVVGSATVAAAPASSAFCHVPAKPSVSSCNQRTPPCSRRISASPKEAQAQEDGWELNAGEEWIDSSHEDGHFVFGPVPTEMEVKEATQELQAALHLGSSLISDPPVEDGCTFIKSSHVLEGSHNNGHMQEPNEIANKHLVPSACIPYAPYASQLALQTGEYSSVYQAFHLLQTNPQVQGAVMSLACDTAVWKAVLNNEKVKELIESFDGVNQEAVNGKGFFITICSHVAHTISNVILKIMNAVSSIYESAYSSMSLNKPVARCMMLTFAVLIVVLIKRKNM